MQRQGNYRRKALEIVTWAAAPLTIFVSGCATDGERPRAPAGGQDVDVVESSGAGGEGGSGAAGGAALGGEGGTSPDPAPTCAQDVAFGTTTIAFTFPTPEDLAVALDRVTYGFHDDPRPLTVVLFAGPERADTSMVTSATRLDDDYSHVFPNSAQPSSAGVVLTPGFLESAAPQSTGFLRVVDDNGRVDLELADVFVRASTSADCSTIVATVDAVIAAHEGNTDLEIDGDDYTIAELAGEGGPSGWPLRAILQAEAITFDFESYQEAP
jgi:hypothetical protein